MKTLLWLFTLFTLVACNPNSTESVSAKSNPSEQTQVQTDPQANAVTANAKSEPVATLSCQLRLGFEAWEPYQFLGLDNQAGGLDIELMQAVAKKMGCVLKPQQGTWLELMNSLKAGDVDMLLGASITPAREEFAYFSKAYRKEQFVLYVRAAELATLNQPSLDAFLTDGKKLGIVSEYHYGGDFSDLISQEQFKPQLIEASLSELNLARLLDEDIDGFIEDSFVARSMLRRKGLEAQISRHPIELSSADVFVMFSKKTITEPQVAAFNQALSDIVLDGSYQQILDKYQQ